MRARSPLPTDRVTRHALHAAAAAARTRARSAARIDAYRGAERCGRARLGVLRRPAPLSVAGPEARGGRALAVAARSANGNSMICARVRALIFGDPQTRLIATYTRKTLVCTCASPLPPLSMAMPTTRRRFAPRARARSCDAATAARVARARAAADTKARARAVAAARARRASEISRCDGGCGWQELRGHAAYARARERERPSALATQRLRSSSLAGCIFWPPPLSLVALAARCVVLRSQRHVKESGRRQKAAAKRARSGEQFAKARARTQLFVTRASGCESR